jgi:hypothetical protein
MNPIDETLLVAITGGAGQNRTDQRVLEQIKSIQEQIQAHAAQRQSGPRPAPFSLQQPMPKR